MAQSVRAHLRYSIDHEWLEDGEPARVGITTVAADALGEVVFVDLPEVGAQVEAGEPCGELESTKSVSDLFSPISGTVSETNQAVVDEPELVNSSPFEEGWLIKATFEALPDDLQAELVQAGERGQVGAGKGSVRHVEVFRTGCVRTPIIGRPRPSPRHRRAAPGRTTATPSSVKSPLCEVPHIKGLFVALEEVRPWVVVPALERYPRC